MKYVKIKDIKPNLKNPRVLKDEKFEKLKRSISEFPEMLELRPIVVDADMMVLGGNMRLRALQDLGVQEVPVLIASELTDEQQREFVIKDNVGFGEWDWDILANEWDIKNLDDWGLNVPTLNSDINLDDFFEQNQDESTEEGKKKIVLEYTDEEYTLVKNGLLKHGKTPEAAVFNLLGL